MDERAPALLCIRRCAAVALLGVAACGPPEPSSTAPGADGDDGSDGSGDTADTGLGGTEDDRDADGFVHWSLTDDPTEADCDDQDPGVTPATERLVAAGAFTRGRDDSEPDQRPARAITVSAYCLDVHEVTNTQFAAFLEAERAAGRDNVTEDGAPLYDLLDDDDEVPERLVQAADGSWSIEPGYENHPVTEVFQWSGTAFCESRGGRLPTEAEWEKAARGLDDRTYPWGDAALDCALANMRPGREGAGGAEPCVGDTTPVGTYPQGAGPFGHLDLTGNAAEWVHDWYRADYYAASPAEDPLGPDTGEAPQYPDQGARLTRGGSFANGDVFQRVSHRFPEPEAGSSNGVGFRCARPL